MTIYNTTRITAFFTCPKSRLPTAHGISTVPVPNIGSASIIPVSTPRRIAYGLPIIKNAVEHTTIFIDIIISCTLKYTFIKLRSPTCTAPTSSLNIVFSRQLLYFSIPAAAYIVPIKHTTSPATAITHHVITGTECFLIIVKNICCPSPSIIIPLHFSKNA